MSVRSLYIMLGIVGLCVLWSVMRYNPVADLLRLFDVRLLLGLAFVFGLYGAYRQTKR